MERYFFYSFAELMKFYNDHREQFHMVPNDHDSDASKSYVKRLEIPGFAEARTCYLVRQYINAATGSGYFDVDSCVVLYNVRTNVAYYLTNFHRASTYELYLNERRFKYDYNSTRYFRFEGEKPNKVGTPTVKKLQAWFDYLDAYAKAEEAYVNRATNAKAEYLKKIKSLGLTVYHWRGDNEGVIRTKNFELEFQCGSDGQIYERIKYTGHSSLENFAQLSSFPLK